jgi:broad specificity phosphatase PhoE
MSIQDVYLIRHGETEWSLSRQHTGTTDIPLTKNGRKVAACLRPLMTAKVLELVLSSPLRRARETCDLAGLGECAKNECDLIEWNYGEYEGLTPRQIHALRPGWLIFKDGCPGGESPDQVAARVDRVIAKVRAVDGDVALFSHGHFLRMFVARWLGLPPAAGSHFILDPATVSTMTYYRGIPAVKQWNVPVMDRSEKTAS